MMHIPGQLYFHLFVLGFLVTLRVFKKKKPNVFILGVMM